MRRLLFSLILAVLISGCASLNRMATSEMHPDSLWYIDTLVDSTADSTEAE